MSGTKLQTVLVGSWRVTQQEALSGTALPPLENVLDSLHIIFDENSEIEFLPVLGDQFVNYMDLNRLQRYTMRNDREVTFEGLRGPAVQGLFQFIEETGTLVVELSVNQGRVRFSSVREIVQQSRGDMPSLSNALAKASELGAGEFFSDMTFKTSDGRAVQAHKVIVGHRSEYIAKKIKKHGATGSKTKNAFSSYSYPVVYGLFQFLYQDDVDLKEFDVSQLKDLLKVAEKCKLPKLQQMCERTIKYSSASQDIVLYIESGLEEFEKSISIMQTLDMTSSDAVFKETRANLIQSIAIGVLKIFYALTKVPVHMKESSKRERKSLAMSIAENFRKLVSLGIRFTEAASSIDRKYDSASSDQDLIVSRSISFVEDFLRNVKEVISLLAEGVSEIEAKLKSKSSVQQLKLAYQMNKLAHPSRKLKTFITREKERSSADRFLLLSQQEKKEKVGRRLEAFGEMRGSFIGGLKRVKGKIEDQESKLKVHDIIALLSSDLGWVLHKYRDYTSHIAPITLMVSGRLNNPEINQLLEKLGFVVDPDASAASSELLAPSSGCIFEEKSTEDLLSSYQADMKKVMSDDSHDTWIVLDDGGLPAHKVVLATRSRYFGAAFLTGLKEASSSQYPFPGYKVSTFTVLLEYIYTGVAPLPEDPNDLMAVAALSDLVQVSDLKDKCLQILKTYIGKENISVLIGFAEQLSLSGFRADCIAFASQTYDDSTPFDGFDSLSEAAKEEILMNWMKRLELTAGSAPPPPPPPPPPAVLPPPVSKARPAPEEEESWELDSEEVSEMALQTLQAMFPELDAERLRELLIAADHDVERAANFCLSLS